MKDMLLSELKEICEKSEGICSECKLLMSCIVETYANPERDYVIEYFNPPAKWEIEK